LTELFQEPGEGDGGEVVGLVPIAKKAIESDSKIIYLKLYLLSSGAPKELCPTKLERLKMKEALKCSSNGY
jgi:hypothetical protein